MEIEALENQLESLQKEARRVSKLLDEKEKTLVLAESCTGGRVAASLAEIPGISERFAGGSVVYQEASKSAWLGISKKSIEKHGVVSAEIAQKMSEGILRRTPHAEIAAAITGHFGPHAPNDLDGVCFISVAIRKSGRTVGAGRQNKESIWFVEEHQLPDFKSEPPRVRRLLRQLYASQCVLTMVRSLLKK